MAVRAVAGRILINQFNQPDAIPPIAFQSVDANSHFSVSFWIKIVEATNYDAVFAYNGKDGSQLIIGYQNGQYFFQFNMEGGIQFSTGFAGNAILGRWTLICFSFEAFHWRLYIGYEADIPNPDVPVVLASIGDETSSIGIPFFFLHLAPSHNTAMCCIKYWNSVLTMADFQVQCNKWAPNDTPAPMWCSTFRTPGDISNIANTRTSPTWYAERGYNQDLLVVPLRESLEISLPDPAYMAKNTPCPTWLYPIVGTNIPEFVDVNPITTPATSTVYKATEFWTMQDRGSVPRFPTTFVSAAYYAYPFHEGAGVPQSDSWPLYIDHNGTEISPNFTDPSKRFEDTTGVLIPNTISALNVYQWQFGGQFTYQPPVGQGTATAKLGYVHILVIYIGFPTGDTGIPATVLTGLFALNKGGKSVDRYNQGVEVKIPDPTVRTAFIGE